METARPCSNLTINGTDSLVWNLGVAAEGQLDNAIVWVVALGVSGARSDAAACLTFYLDNLPAVCSKMLSRNETRLGVLLPEASGLACFSQ